jgi:hypothetical protein
MDKEKYSCLYKDILSSGVSREDALSLILVHKGFKDAMTTVFNKKLISILRKNRYIFELDESYQTGCIYGFIEHTTKLPLPGAEVVKRLYVGRDICREKLKQLKSVSDFDQGVRFGFPMCDIIYYCRKAKYEKKLYMDIFSDWISHIPGRDNCKDIDFRFIGNLIKYLSSSRLILHIPHHHLCPLSLELAQRNLEVLEQVDPEFKQAFLKESFRPLLLYGNSWETIGMIQLEGLSKVKPCLYRAKAVGSLPERIPRGVFLDIRLVSEKEVRISVSGKEIVKSTAVKRIPWSYWFFLPYDSLGLVNVNS